MEDLLLAILELLIEEGLPRLFVALFGKKKDGPNSSEKETVTSQLDTSGSEVADPPKPLHDVNSSRRKRLLMGLKQRQLQIREARLARKLHH